jgi:hypothetical protein
VVGTIAHTYEEWAEIAHEYPEGEDDDPFDVSGIVFPKEEA